MKKNKLYVALLFASIITFCSCSDYPGYKKADSGLYYKFYVQNEDAQKPEIGDAMTLNMLYKVQETDSVIFSANSNMLSLFTPLYNGDISEGLAMMAVGDSASFIINADSFFLKNIGLPKSPDFIKPETKLVFEFKLLSLKKKAEIEKEQQEQLKLMEERKNKEPEDIKKYITDNKIVSKPTASGLYYIEVKKGTGVKAENGKTVSVHYTGKLLDGTVFDSSEGKEPIGFVLGLKQVITGWDEGIALMRVGGKAKLLIPSSLAYGANGAGQVILPFTPLVFEVQLVSVTDAPTAKK